MLPKNDSHSSEWIDQIESLVYQAETIDDPAARSIALELSQAILRFHQCALSRMLDFISAQGSGDEILSRIAQDDLTSSLLLVHDLHPEPIETRLARAIARLDDVYRALGARISLACMSGGIACIDFESSRAWPGPQTRSSIEKVLFQAAPELEGVVIQGMKEEASPDFIPVSAILAGSQA